MRLNHTKVKGLMSRKNWWLPDFIFDVRRQISITSTRVAQMLSLLVVQLLGNQFQSEGDYRVRLVRDKVSPLIMVWLRLTAIILRQSGKSLQIIVVSFLNAGGFPTQQFESLFSKGLDSSGCQMVIIWLNSFMKARLLCTSTMTGWGLFFMTCYSLVLNFCFQFRFVSVRFPSVYAPFSLAFFFFLTKLLNTKAKGISCIYIFFY